jgi:phospholipid-binding lipoprotein MlaA
MHRCPPRLGLSRAIVFLAWILSGCAAQPAHPGAGAEDFNDPFENTNRAIFRFNEKVDAAVIAPVARAYRDTLPDGIRESVHNFFNNLGEPLIFANDMLQGDPGRALDTAARFAVNSTIGVGGLVDIAGNAGLPYRDNDLGITFAVWGVGEGPYLVIPVLGPSNPRDLAGNVIEGYGDPWDTVASDNGYIWIPFVRALASGIDTRSRYLDALKDLKRTSLDYYAAIRSLYRQRRAALARHQHENLPANPSLSDNAPARPQLATNPRPELGIGPE